MVDARGAASAVFLLVSVAVYAFVGLRLRRRTLPGPSGRAWRLFALWWLALSAYTAIGAFLGLVAVSGAPTGTLALVLVPLAALLVCVMFWALLSYLVFLLTGRDSWFRPLTALYAAQLVGYVGLVVWLAPTGVAQVGWVPTVGYARVPSDALRAFATLVFLVPPILASLAYVRLYRRVEDRTARYRILLVGGSVFAWMATGLASSFASPTDDAFHVLARTVGVLAALAVVAAYDPPAWARDRWGVEPLRARSGDDDARRARARLEERLRQLV